MSIVSFRNAGRMGNFLFEAAAAYGYSKKHGLEFAVPAWTHNPVWSPIYLQHLAHPNYVQGREDILINEVWTTNQHYQEIEFRPDWVGRQIILNGYWQSHLYWDFVRDEMINDFRFPWKHNKGVCSIHVRRGDYLLYPTKHPVITIEYLRLAIELMRDKKGIKKFLFHSDDIPWCITSGVHLLFPDCEFEYSTGKNEVEDLISMSECEHQIISNSTLAWWGAELNQNKRKVVVVPSLRNWFGPDNHLTVKDLYRPEWIQIDYKPSYEK